MKVPQVATIGPLFIHLPHPTHEQCMTLRVVTTRVLLRPQWLFYDVIGDRAAISSVIFYKIDRGCSW